ncbi:MAG: helix-turn-helix transcriptional regulator [Clostridiaceae bacterium]
MIGDNLRKILKDRRIDSKEFAKLLGISTTYVSYLLNNKRKPSFELLDNIAEKLNVSFDDILGTDSEKLAKEVNEIEDTIKKAKEIAPTLPVIPEEFTDPVEARAFVKSFVIFGSNGFNSDKLNDDEILQFANELLEHMDTVKYKYKK